MGLVRIEARATIREIDAKYVTEQISVAVNVRISARESTSSSILKMNNRVVFPAFGTRTIAENLFAGHHMGHFENQF